MVNFEPAYIETFKKGLLAQKIKRAREILKCCTLCPRQCKVDRTAGETGVCKTGEKAYVSSFNAHFGEEDPLVGTYGSGTIFFTYCNLMCIFCQNYDISHLGQGEEISDEQLADIMLRLQNKRCHNINFVTPSHVVPQILSALAVAVPKGLSLPLVYNTGGYDSVDTLKLLDGVFDIYMPDFKFWDPAIAKATCNAENYPEVAQQAMLEMHRQAGDLVLDDTGIAQRGILLRHLVLPSGLSGTREIMRFIARRVSKNTYVNIMPQYRPCGRAGDIKELSVHPSNTDYETALQAAEEEGIKRLDRRRRRFMVF
jgi:putative pyruvate formate lyase activating enzyme